MGRQPLFFVNGRQPHVIGKWKMILSDCKWKTTSIHFCK